MTSEIHQRIVEELLCIENKDMVRVLYACESGSRAWGFDSTNSDYDVRFIYIHRPEWYLSIDDRRDVIELPINDMLDINGWDIRKALKLFRKSNPPLMEWLKSPTVYLEQFSTAKTFREMSKLFFSPRNCLCHYLNMAEGNYRQYLRGEYVKIKQYFYVLRPVLACMWIEAYNTAPPMEFEVMLDSLLPNDELVENIHSLLKRKRSGEEMDLEPRVEEINQFIEASIEHFEEYISTVPRPKTPETQMLNELFREALTEVYS